jgi:hypothetical protein
MRKVFLSILTVSLVALVCVGYLFLRDVSRSFPDLPEGVYVGLIRSDGEESGIPLYVQRASNSPVVVVAVGDQEFPAQHAPIRDPSGRERLPLIISGGDFRFRLTGGRKEEGRFEGESLDPIHNKKGTWYLQRTEIGAKVDREDDDLRSWFLMVSELQKVESSIEGLKRRYDAQKNKMEKLSRYLVDDGSLREKATSRLTSTSSALDEARESVSKLQAELDATIGNVELSQRVSPKGRLVLLSRESLQRESRWIEITLKLLAPETVPGFEEQLERAHRVKEVQDQIEAERRLMEEIDTLDRYRGVEAETPNEEEFYRGLQ